MSSRAIGEPDSIEASNPITPDYTHLLMGEGEGKGEPMVGRKPWAANLSFLYCNNGHAFWISGIECCQG